MKRSLKLSRQVVNFHLPRTCNLRFFAAVRAINYYCPQVQLAITQDVTTRTYRHVTLELSFLTATPMAPADLLAGLYTLTAAGDITLQDCNVVQF